jgi:carboxypeptidase family protein
MSKRRSFHSLCALTLTLCLGFGAIPVLAQSQATAGQISGVVTDNQGAAITGATVKATNSQTGLERSTTSNEEGAYSIISLPPGVYTLSGDASGFGKATFSNIEVLVGRTYDQKITLAASGVQEVVNVTAGAIQVQTTRSEADAILNERAINNLPINGRRFQDFVTLTPAAQVDPRRQNISLSGQLGIHSNVSIDGADYNNPFFGGLRGGERSNNAYTVPQESIKEFQVVGAGYTAEFGRSTGGIVNAVTKSGTNEFHGSAFFLYRPNEWSKRGALLDAVDLQVNGSRRLQGLPPFDIVAAPTQKQWGGSIGGPIKKDKLFFFGAYEQQKQLQPRQVLFDPLAGLPLTENIEEAAAFLHTLEVPFDQTNDAIAFIGRADWTVNDKHNANFRYNFSDNSAENATSNGVPLFPTINSAVSNNGTEKDRTHTVVGQLNSFLGAALVNELRAQYSRENRPRIANSKEPLVSSTIGNYGTVSFLGENNETDWRFQITDSMTWSKGQHTFKFGGEYNHIFATQTFGFNQFGAFGFTTFTVPTILDIMSFTPGFVPPTGTTTIVNRFDSTAATYRKQIGNLEASMKFNEAAFFLQDSWRLRPNLTLNLGLRWEGQYNPQPEVGNDALISLIKGFRFPSGHILDPTQIPNDANNFGPRFGFAWDPWSDGKTVIRGYGGVYYSRTPALLFAGPINNFRDPAGDLSIQLPLTAAPGNPNAAQNTVYKQLKLIGIDLNNFSLGSLPIISTEQIRQIATLLGVDPLTAGVQPIAMANDYQNPKSVQYGIGVERELSRSVTVGADFSYVHTAYLQQNRDLNLPLPFVRSLALDPAQRPFFGLITGPNAAPCNLVTTPPNSCRRPILGPLQIQVRESTGKALFRALTLRMKFQQTWGQFNAFYVRSKNLSDGDNEREAGGVLWENSQDTHSEYGFSNLDVKHQFVMNPVFFLPHGFDFSAAIRLRSGRPIDARMGSDVNQDGINLDRPFHGPGVPFVRNAFRNKAQYNIDLRAQKRFNVGETRRIILSIEVFNPLNIDNIELAGSTVTNFCSSTSAANCGFLGPTNPNFLALRESNPTNARFGSLLLGNNSGSPFQVQAGARFTF